MYIHIGIRSDVYFLNTNIFFSTYTSYIRLKISTWYNICKNVYIYYYTYVHICIFMGYVQDTHTCVHVCEQPNAFFLIKNYCLY